MKTRWSGVGMVAGSGGLGGSVIGKGRSGATVRVRVKPVNPRTNKQIAQRSKFSTRSAAWRSLTAAQQLAWNGAADSGAFPLKNTLGITFQPTGAQLYNQLNLNIVQVGGTAITDPPQKMEMQEILLNLLIAESSGSAFFVGFDDDVATGMYAEIFATGSLSPGISRPDRSQYRYIGYVDDNLIVNLSAEYTAVFGAPILGQKVFAYAVLTTRLTGQTSQIGSMNTIVYTE